MYYEAYFAVSVNEELRCREVRFVYHCSPTFARGHAPRIRDSVCQTNWFLSHLLPSNDDAIV